MTSKFSITRRKFLAASSVSAAAIALEPQTSTAQAAPTKGKPFRICFFTDAHLPSENSHPKRLPNDKLHHQERIDTAFKSANAHKPNAYVFGGDNYFAIDQGNTEANVILQCENWKRVVKQHVKVPHVSVIGNHDIWHPKGKKPKDPKAYAVKTFEMPHRYYTKILGGWKFVMLDIFGSDGFNNDKKQQVWFEKQINCEQNVCIVTHTPIFSVTNQIEGGPKVGDLNKMRSLFIKHKNVKLALSGHQHLIDNVKFDNVTYICGGSVSGAWWGGDYKQTPPAYMIFDLYPDGSHKQETIFWEEK